MTHIDPAAGCPDEEPDSPPWYPVAPEEAPGLIAAYEHADAMARELEDALVTAGIPPGTVAVVPSLNAAGQPVVHVRMPNYALHRLRWLLHSGAGPPPAYDDQDQRRSDIEPSRLGGRFLS